MKQEVYCFELRLKQVFGAATPEKEGFQWNSSSGRATDDGDSIRFYDKSNNPKGWYDRDTNTTFDKNNRPIGTIYDFYREE
jgi:hypothetical protein